MRSDGIRYVGMYQANFPPVSNGGLCGGNPLTGETRPPGMSRGRVVNSHATPP